MPNQRDLDLRYLRLAHVVALDASKDPSTKVGAVLVGADSRQLSTGYNGMLTGAKDDDSVWLDRTIKYPRVIHAEINAILNCPFDRRGSTLYTTLRPCATCLNLCIQAGVTRFVWYGLPWAREPQDNVELVEEWLSMVQWTAYETDSVVEGIREVYTNAK